MLEPSLFQWPSCDLTSPTNFSPVVYVPYSIKSCLIKTVEVRSTVYSEPSNVFTPTQSKQQNTSLYKFSHLWVPILPLSFVLWLLLSLQLWELLAVPYTYLAQPYFKDLEFAFPPAKVLLPLISAWVTSSLPLFGITSQIVFPAHLYKFWCCSIFVLCATPDGGTSLLCSKAALIVAVLFSWSWIQL